MSNSPSTSNKSPKPAVVGSATSSFKTEYGQGRRKLLDAAARLVAREGSARLTLRELAKEAGMSHNSIYRHFPSVVDMMPALIGDFTLQLREGLRRARAQVPPNELSSRTVVGWLLDFALSNKDTFVVTMRERHGPIGPARAAIEQGAIQILADMRSDLAAAGRLPPLPADKLDLALRVIIQQTFELCLLYIEAPERREALLVEAELIFAWCLAGAVMVSGETMLPLGEAKSL
ncbi:TetR/AcrR family transcriptional regulator [Aquabacterium sp.]|uniref:TetR/AcrR family transcriptional regulator n=1 Tax=Aquabacterium sp. TaxID=1872578 RepID=UPI004037BB8C